MTKEELFEKYDFKESKEEFLSRLNDLHPVYKRHLSAAWVIQSVWGHASMENISLGKAREMTASIIEEHLENFIKKIEIYEDALKRIDSIANIPNDLPGNIYGDIALKALRGAKDVD